MPRLIVRDGPLSGQRLDITTEVVIGRSGADIEIDDPGLAERHLRVRPAGSGIEVEDLGSLNGTWIENKRLDGRKNLQPGAVLQLGATRLELEQSAAPAPASAAERSAGMPAAPAAPALTASAPFAPAAGRRAPGAASLLWLPTIICFAIIAATAAALIIYFAQR